jgi:hypothetical protein
MGAFIQRPTGSFYVVDRVAQCYNRLKRGVRDMARSAVVSVVLILLFLSGASARSWRITSDGTGDAPTIQAGIDSAGAGDTVLVMPGVYSENLVIKDAVVLKSSDGRDSTSVKPAMPDAPLVRCDSLGSGIVIEGFTFRDAHSVTGNAGILGQDSWLEITANRFTNNYSAGNGGAIALYGGGGMISGNVFEADTAGTGGGTTSGNIFEADSIQGYWGGAIHCADNASPSIEGNTFQDCRAACGGAISCAYGASPWIGYNHIVSNEAGWGGGIFCRYDASPIIKANLIEGNVAVAGGGGIKCQDTERVWVRENTIKFNSGLRGGGFQTTNVAFPNFWLNIFWGNSAEREGGAARIGGCLTGKCFSNTFFENTAIEQGSSISATTGPLEELNVRYCIVAHSAGAPAVDGSVINIDCSDFWNNDVDIGPGCTVGPGVFYLDPMFCSPDSGDFNIDSDSPCVDYPDCGLIGALGAGCGSSAGLPDQTASPDQGSVMIFRNPCFDGTRVTFSVPVPGHAAIAVYDASGRKVAVLADRHFGIGVFDLSWNGRDFAGRQVAPGVYFCRLEASGLVTTGKMVLLR